MAFDPLSVESKAHGIGQAAANTNIGRAVGMVKGMFKAPKLQPLEARGKSITEPDTTAGIAKQAATE
jgi:hypothetical protein